jgi:hypothetical protein
VYSRAGADLWQVQSPLAADDGEPEGGSSGAVPTRGREPKNHVFIGTDCGATTSKIGAASDTGKTVSRHLFRNPTNSQQGRACAWIEAPDSYRIANKLSSNQLDAVGLAIPDELCERCDLMDPENTTKVFRERPDGSREHHQGLPRAA